MLHTCGTPAKQEGCIKWLLIKRVKIEVKVKLYPKLNFYTNSGIETLICVSSFYIGIGSP